MSAPIRAVVRFGTRRIALSLADPRYVRAFDTHLRSVLEAAPEADAPVDLAIDVRDDRSSASGPDGLEVRRDGERVTWRSPVGEATIAGERASFRLRPSAAGEDVLLFWFTVLLQRVLLATGLVRLHAGAASIGERTVVFTGEKGAGKSTLALGLGHRGAAVLGDDQLAVEVDGDRVVVAGSHPTIRLTTHTEGLLPAPLDVPPIVLAGVAKKEVPLGDLVPAHPYEAYRPTDLWFPAVGERFAIEPISRPDALQRLVRAVAPHQRFADRRDRVDFLAVLGGLVAATRPAAVTLSPDLADLAQAWDSLQG